MSRLLPFSLILFYFLGSCESQKPVAIGADNEIIVFADSAEWIHMEETLRAAFERSFRTPQEEREFTLRRTPLSVLRTYEKHKLLLFLGTLDATGPVSQTVQGMLGESARQAVENGTHFVFTRDDEWARGQLLMILTATDIQDLRQQCIAESERLFLVADEHKTRIVSSFMYRTAAPLEDKMLQNEVFQKYGWFLRIHPDFKLVEQNEDSNYVRFHSHSRYSSLQRWITVHWIDSPTDTVLTHSFLKQQRNRMGHWFVDPVRSVDGFDQFYVGSLASYRALIHRGIWRSDAGQNAFGGAFRTYGFYEPTQQRIYLIDQAVFFPEEPNKLTHLRILDVISQTFSITNPNL